MIKFTNAFKFFKKPQPTPMSVPEVRYSAAAVEYLREIEDNLRNKVKSNLAGVYLVEKVSVRRAVRTACEQLIKELESNNVS